VQRRQRPAVSSTRPSAAGELVSLFTERNFGKGRRGFVFHGKALGYTFLTPDGRRLYAGGSELVTLKPGMNPLPQHGMSVAVLYVDDSCFRML
jgi:hypothetical protein